MELATQLAPTATHSASSSGVPVDLTHLGRYTLGNTDLEREVLALFSEQAAATLEALRLASSPKAWREAAHTLKGAALAVGAWQVAKCGQQAEVAEYNGASREAILARLEQAVGEAKAFIARL